jgi:AcrR family transcriptional regulator
MTDCTIWYMYRMVHSIMASSQARDRLLAAAVAQARHGGIGDLSLRELAAAIGTSHRMLLYHFGSREGLLTAVSRAVEEAERSAQQLSTAVTPDGARQLWRRVSDPELWPAERLFFELYVQSLLGRPGTEGFARESVTAWTGPVAQAMADAGLDQATARAEARLGLAVIRGLILDLLATGELAEVRAAHEQYLGHYAPAEEISPAPETPPDTGQFLADHGH